MTEFIRTDNLLGGYVSGVDILKGISLSVPAGKTIAVLGLNGSGKSTLGKALMNMIPFRSGELYLDGERVTQCATDDLVQRGLSIMLQGGRVFETLSVWDNIVLASCRKKTPVDYLQSIFPLLEKPRRVLEKTMADTLSGGQKHQLALAMALATEPKLLILDEPSAGLSPKSTDDIYVVLKKVRQQNLTIILIEQNIAKAVEFCDTSLFLSSGVVVRKSDSKDLSEIEGILFKESYDE